MEVPEPNRFNGHRHELDPAISEVSFECNGCKQLGFGSCYKCPTPNCNYIVHTECHNPVLTLSYHCANLPPAYSFPDSDMKIYLRKRIRSKCLKCNSKKRSSGKVQGLSYVSSDGNLCYHVACLNEALVNANGENNECLELQNLAQNQVARPQNFNAMKGLKWIFKFIKAVIFLLFGDHITLVSTLYQLLQD